MKLEATVSNPERAIASRNLLRLLRLLPGSQTLIISAQLPQKPDPQIISQREMALELIDQGEKEYRLMHVEFDSTWPEDQLAAQTRIALRQLEVIIDNFQNVNSPTAVICFGDGLKMSAIYKAIDEAGQSKGEKIRMANFFGFTSEDTRAFSELTEEKMEEIAKANESFGQLLKDEPVGTLKIASQGNDGQERIINFGYNILKHPIIRDSDNFGSFPKSSMAEYGNIVFLNIPSGEESIKSDSAKVDGEFSAQGLIFRVEDGLLTNIGVSRRTKFNDLNPSQQKFYSDFYHSQKENNRLRGNFFAFPKELSLGLFQLAGIDTDADPSSLTFGKSDPHINFIRKYQGPFAKNENFPVGFALDNAVMKTAKGRLFYPPPQKGANFLL